MAEAQHFFLSLSLNGTRRISSAEQQRRLRFATCHNATLGTHIQQGAAGTPVRQASQCQANTKLPFLNPRIDSYSFNTSLDSKGNALVFPLPNLPYICQLRLKKKEKRQKEEVFRKISFAAASDDLERRGFLRCAREHHLSDNSDNHQTALHAATLRHLASRQQRTT